MVKFRRFISFVSQDFNPSFLSYVDVNKYYNKIVENAELIYWIDNSDIIGLVVIYCNNFVNKESYIPFVAVRKEYRSRGIAKSLLIQAESIAKAHGMSVIKIRTNNKVALSLYKKLGFKEYDVILEEGISLERYYLIKQIKS